MIPDAFSTTGFAAFGQGDHKIKTFQVMGERGSGTNYVKRLVGRNTPLKPTDVLGWKHGFPHMLAVPYDVAVIGVVRAADQWARSLFETPWHSSAALQSLAFSDFIRAPWDTRIDKAKHFQDMMQPAMRGAPLQLDRDPRTGRMFDNIFALRRAKLSGLLSFGARECRFILVRMEDVQRAPETYLDQIADALGVVRSKTFSPVVKRQGWRFKTRVDVRPPLPTEWTASDYDFLKSEIDPAQEAALGYSYTDPPTIKTRHIGREWDDN